MGTLAAVASLGIVAFNVIAAALDFTGFVSVATPGLLFWLTTCSACCVALTRLILFNSRAPRYFNGVLLAGCLAGVLTLPSVFEVLGKREAPDPETVTSSVEDFRGQTLRDVSFAGANLRNAQLRGSRLIDVDFGGAILAEADLREATLIRVNLSGADMCGADLRGTDLRRATGLRQVERWSYAFYNDETKTRLELGIVAIPGPIKDTGNGLLYMCDAGQTRRIPR